jgi:hypothetical protein
MQKASSVPEREALWVCCERTSVQVVWNAREITTTTSSWSPTARTGGR